MDASKLAGHRPSLLEAGGLKMTHRMPDTVYASAISGRDAAGDPTFKARRKIAARVEFDSKRVRLADGTEAVSDATIYTHDEMREGERCWLPGDSSKDTEKAWEVIRVQKAKSFSSGRTVYQAAV